MRGRTIPLLAGTLGLLLCTGCAHMKMKCHKSKGCAPDACVAGEGGEVMIDGMPGRPVTFVDRHPLLYKPRDVYHNTNHHGVVKAAAATVVGVPAGVVCEVGQVFKGCPPGM